MPNESASPNVPVPLAPAASETPEDYIPGTYTLGSTYDVLNGRYADNKSTKQQVIDWKKSGVRVQEFGKMKHSVPDVVNYTFNPTTDYRSVFGKDTSEYSNSLSVQAGLEAECRGFSASASVDYSDSQRENISNAFTRITYNVTHYNLSLPPIDQVKGLLKQWFVDHLNNKDPIELYNEYGTHLLRSLTIGGRALFLYSTDTRSYDSEISVDVAAKLSASYGVASGKIELSVKQKEAMQKFNESSQRSIVTKGGDPQYGNEKFLDNVEKWAASILDYPEFVDFGSLPAFIGLWELATTPERRDTLHQAYKVYINQYKANLSLPGPYIHARISEVWDKDKTALLPEHIVKDNEQHPESASGTNITFPIARSDGWNFISPSVTRSDSDTPKIVIVKELVPGALAPVKWVEIATGPPFTGFVSRFWRAVPPTPDYIALGFIAVTEHTDQPSKQPPESLAGQFRAVHKAALTRPVKGVTNVIHGYKDQPPYPNLYEIDNRYFLVDSETPPKDDCYVLDPEMCIKDGDGW